MWWVDKVAKICNMSMKDVVIAHNIAVTVRDKGVLLLTIFDVPLVAAMHEACTTIFFEREEWSRIGCLEFDNMLTNIGFEALHRVAPLSPAFRPS